MGGLGMLDIKALDESLKLRALGRLLATEHPFLKMVRNKIDLEQFFNPQLNVCFERVIEKGIGLLKEDRGGLWEKADLESNLPFLKLVGSTAIKLIVNNAGVNSIPFYIRWRRGVRQVKDLTNYDINQLTFYIDPKKVKLIKKHFFSIASFF